MVGSKPYVIDGDLGCGAPGSREWHKCVIAQIKDAEIAEYMKKALGADVKTRTEALEYIDGHSDGDN